MPRPGIRVKFLGLQFRLFPSLVFAVVVAAAEAPRARAVAHGATEVHVYQEHDEKQDPEGDAEVVDETFGDVAVGTHRLNVCKKWAENQNSE